MKIQHKTIIFSRLKTETLLALGTHLLSTALIICILNQWGLFQTYLTSVFWGVCLFGIFFAVEQQLALLKISPKTDFAFLDILPCAAACLNAEAKVLKSNNYFEHYFSNKTGHPVWEENRKLIKNFLQSQPLDREKKILLKNIAYKQEAYWAVMSKHQNKTLLVLIKLPQNLSALSIYRSWRQRLAQELYVSLSNIQAFAKHLLSKNAQLKEVQVILEESHKLLNLTENFVQGTEKMKASAEDLDVKYVLETANVLYEPMREDKIESLTLSIKSMAGPFFSYGSLLKSLLEKLVLDQAKGDLLTHEIIIDQDMQMCRLELAIEKLPIYYPLYEEKVRGLQGNICVKEALNRFQIVIELPCLEEGQQIRMPESVEAMITQ